MEVIPRDKVDLVDLSRANDNIELQGAVYVALHSKGNLDAINGRIVRVLNLDRNRS